VLLVVHALVDEAEASEEARVNHEGGDLRVQPRTLQAILSYIVLQLFQI
jgi:hypothetical protein